MRRWLTAALAIVAAGCRENPAGPEPADPVVYNPDWTPATHGRGPPNYQVVFPQDAVNTIEIAMTAAQWTAIRANMTSLWGFDFGDFEAAGPGGGGQFPTTDPAYVAVALRFNQKQWRDVGFRLKGNSSLSFAWRGAIYKLPFRLQFDEFEDSIPAIANQRFYGFRELSMSPGWSDNSLIREKTAADIFRIAGVPAARTAFTRVFIDFGEGLKYCGVYTMVEVIDDTMVKDQFGEDAGNIYKPESRFQTFVAAEFEKKVNAAADHSDVRAMIAALNSALRSSDPSGWRADLERAFNVDHFLKWLAVSNAIVNWDSYGGLAHNYYLYHHSARRLLWIPWDHNLSLSGNPGLTGAITGPASLRNGRSLTMNEVDQSWPLIHYLVADSVYFQVYLNHLRAFYREVFTEDRMVALLDRYRDLIAPHVTGPNGEQPGCTFLSSSAQFVNAHANLKAHVRSRRALLATFVP